MSDPKTYISRHRTEDPKFDEGFDDDYQVFEIGALPRQTRQAFGLTTNRNVGKAPRTKVGHLPNRKSRRGHQAFHTEKIRSGSWPVDSGIDSIKVT
uniref:Uncharacterized protein n=1 Tax=Candidatus Kentrum sp. LFY TaxID=2126342 RepID=A0A450V122_9GAMM|nr:MAG: hypothetical protein BECKLFY1418B_GA0070995_104821 [Candidatus Kentron sp. LFY]VFJ98425.1 MAG: hypothetical protein BECKLFY1418A_GA0070994_10838 [Candidatus Kentron sp. LFY]